ncbi:MAG TPA: hypothetical protein VFF73_23180 [Planctomycetota bacterium]|nr:hypothetical protein [Planctomycetota bacterium]
MRGMEQVFPKRLREARTSCTVAGCPNDTNGRKPFCIEHLDRLPYVQELLAELSRREVGIDGAGHAEDVLDHLELHGTATLGRLAREVHVPKKKLETCVAALERAGIVETEQRPARHGHKLQVVKLARARTRVAG